MSLPMKTPWELMGSLCMTHTQWLCVGVHVQFVLYLNLEQSAKASQWYYPIPHLLSGTICIPNLVSMADLIHWSLFFPWAHLCPRILLILATQPDTKTKQNWRLEEWKGDSIALSETGRTESEQGEAWWWGKGPRMRLGGIPRQKRSGLWGTWWRFLRGKPCILLLREFAELCQGKFCDLRAWKEIQYQAGLFSGRLWQQQAGLVSC